MSFADGVATPVSKHAAAERYCLAIAPHTCGILRVRRSRKLDVIPANYELRYARANGREVEIFCIARLRITLIQAVVLTLQRPPSLFGHWTDRVVNDCRDEVCEEIQREVWEIIDALVMR